MCFAIVGMRSLNRNKELWLSEAFPGDNGLGTFLFFWFFELVFNPI